MPRFAGTPVEVESQIDSAPTKPRFAGTPVDETPTEPPSASNAGEDSGFGLNDAAALYGGSVMAALTGGNFGGQTARRWIGQAVPALAEGVVDSTVSAVTAPGRAYSGELQVLDANGNVTPEAIAEGVNFAGVMSPSSVANQVPSQVGQRVLRNAPEGLAVAEAGQRLGVALPRAVVSDTTGVQQVGKILSNIPIGGTPLRNASRNAIEQLGEAAARTQQDLGLADVAAAGAGVRSGLTEFSRKTLADQVKGKYDAVDEFVTQNVVTPLSRTKQVASQILGDRLNSQLAGNSRAVGLVSKALNQADGLNYRGIKGLRSSIGELLDDPAMLAHSGASESELKAIYGALSDDLRTAVSRGGGADGLKAFEEANTLAAKVAKEREAFDRILGKSASDENIFTRIEAMAGTDGRASNANLMKLRGALSKDTWNDLGATVLSRIGRDKEGNFSPDRFITGWGKLSKGGKDILFRGEGREGLIQSLDDIAKVSSRFKQLNQYANPSGSGQTVIGGGIGFGLATEPVSLISSVVGGRALSSYLAKPLTAKKLANWAKSYEQAVAKPGLGADQILDQRARVLALDIAETSGVPALADQVYPLISRIGQLPAEPGDENQGSAEGENDGVDRQPRYLLPNEA